MKNCFILVRSVPQLYTPAFSPILPPPTGVNRECVYVYTSTASHVVSLRLKQNELHVATCKFFFKHEISVRLPSCFCNEGSFIKKVMFWLPNQIDSRIKVRNELTTPRLLHVDTMHTLFFTCRWNETSMMKQCIMGREKTIRDTDMSYNSLAVPIYLYVICVQL
jgi:hypothetical protein